MKEAVFEVEFPGDTSNLEGIRNFVIEIAGRYGFSTGEIDDIEFAVDEAVTNIIKHAYECETSKIQVKVLITDDIIKIILHDNGTFFDPTKAKPVDIEEYHNKGKSSGLGIYIVSTLMDEVLHNFIEGDGNYLTLIKKKKQT